MKSIKTLTDPESFELMADETRRKIIFLLRVKEMTVSQIASELNLTPQAVYHHIKRLVKGELVEVSREVRVDHLIESYYRATAEVFNFNVGNVRRDKKFLREQTITIFKALNKLGFNLDAEEKKLSRLTDLHNELSTCCGSAKFEDAISNMDDVDIVTKMEVQEYAEILSMSDEEFERQQELRKRFRDTLISLIKSKKKEE
ncbi:MAG TPA: winged helix-turn-helix domain-containing protein [Candidatus Bathyarchaeia archaeon]|nr:winged helix-turn-helix domain-containing protein [Candidatus Bathyarchaeia archaeon]